MRFENFSEIKLLIWDAWDLNLILGFRRINFRMWSDLNKAIPFPLGINVSWSIIDIYDTVQVLAQNMDGITNEFIAHQGIPIEASSYAMCLAECFARSFNHSFSSPEISMTSSHVCQVCQFSWGKGSGEANARPWWHGAPFSFLHSLACLVFFIPDYRAQHHFLRVPRLAKVYSLETCFFCSTLRLFKGSSLKQKWPELVAPSQLDFK